MNQTENYGLNQWESTDRILMDDFNADNAKIDEALAALAKTTPVSRGGTGKSSWTANRLIYPSASTTLAQLAFPSVAGSVLRQGTAGAPYWTSVEALEMELIGDNGGGWKLLASYKAAGAYTFTVPAGVTEIGVYMVGGGGAGGVGLSNGTSRPNATGGASGYGKNIVMQVTPGQQISLVVGAGGVPGVVAPGNDSDGSAGGTTSFGGETVSGGAGGEGKYSSNANIYVGALGGQPSDACCEAEAWNNILHGCVAATWRETSYGYDYSRNPQPAREAQNQFDPTMVTLCAGVACLNGTFQTLERLPDGTGGGISGAIDATGNGNGGAGNTLQDTTGATTSLSGGKGSDGMILIYKRGV